MVMEPVRLCGLVAAAYISASLLAQGVTVEPAHDWSALFDRDSGWTGADGIYSIPISGDDSFGSAPRTNTLWVFGDTFIGEVDSNGRRLPGSRLVNNTLAFLRGPDPDPASMTFLWGREADGDPSAVFVPDTPDSEPGDWYWVKDGFVAGETGYLFAYRFRRDRSEPIGYRR